MVGIAANILQAFALLAVMEVGNNRANPASQFALGKQCNVDTTSEEIPCTPTIVRDKLPSDDNMEQMVPKFANVNRCQGDCGKKFRCSPSESGIKMKNVEVKRLFSCLKVEKYQQLYLKYFDLGFHQISKWN